MISAKSETGRLERNEPRFLLSTNCQLAWRVNERYYRGCHFVWASVPPGFAYGNATSPASADPMAIYASLKLDIESRDHNSAKIRDLRRGIVRGATARTKDGTITSDVRREIIDIARAAELDDFTPLLYVIDYALVREKVVNVPVRKRAHPLSFEWQIQNLLSGEFHVLEFPSSRK